MGLCRNLTKSIRDLNRAIRHLRRAFAAAKSDATARVLAENIRLLMEIRNEKRELRADVCGFKRRCRCHCARRRRRRRRRLRRRRCICFC